MNLRRKALAALMLVFIIGLGSSAFAQPVFENSTPRGFSPDDSTTSDTAVVAKEISVLVDLNEAVNFTYPVIANFQKVERSVPYFSSASSTGRIAKYMSQAVALDDNGNVHRAWVQQRGTARDQSGGTPVYGVVYAKSFDGGKTFTDTVSVSGTLRFDLITPNALFESGFSTVDIVVNSNGDPRVVYAMDQSPDGDPEGGSGAFGDNRTGGVSGDVKAYKNIYFNYSNDGGSSWLPANSAVVVNDTATVANGGGALSQWPGRNCAFPRMAITSTDDIFIVYGNRLHGAGGALNEPNIHLAKVDEDSLKLGSAQSVLVGGLGTVGSQGGVRIDQIDAVGLGPDIAVGDDDVLHVVWYNDLAATNQIQHKTLPASLWNVVNAAEGWNQAADGANVFTFSTAVAGITNDKSLAVGDPAEAAIGAERHHLFPTVVVDKGRTPDRIYVLWKYAGAEFVHENIQYNNYDYDGLTGNNVTWATTATYAFPQGNTGDYSAAGGGGLFQDGTRFGIESSWAFVDRIAAVVDDRKGTQGDLHIVFSGGATGLGISTLIGAATPTVGNYLYYSRFNGNEWELPQVVATALDDDSGTEAGTPDGVSSKYQMLFEPDIAMRSGDDNVYLTFVGGSPRAGTPGRGLPTMGGTGGQQNAIAPNPFFKRIGRTTSFDDVSVPKGAFQYVLSYTPTNPQSFSTAPQFNMIAVTAADNGDGSGIGGSTPGSSQAPGGFLTGQWSNVSAQTLGVTSLTPGTTGAVFKGAVSQSQANNDNGVFEGLVDDSGTNAFGEWGDDADKVGLLVKLNVLAGNSVSTTAPANLYVIRASTASRGADASTNSALESQSIALQGHPGGAGGFTSTFVKGYNSATTFSRTANFATAPRGSYFQIGARVDIVAANVAPVVSIDSPNATTSSGGAFSNETASIRYVLFDLDDGFGDDLSDDLQAELYWYPDNGLTSVQDIRTFGTLIVDDTDDNVNVTQTALSGTGTGDFIEGSSANNIQTYTWDDPGALLQNRGWAAVTKTPDGLYYIYIVADDGSNPPIFAVSEGTLRVRHIPLVKSVAPVAADTVDTGEYTNLVKVNPYKIRFQLVDYDDNAQVRLFFATTSALNSQNVVVSGTELGSLTLDLSGATPIQLSDSLRTDEDVAFEFDVTAQGSNRDSIIAQGNYTIYAVVADGDSSAVAGSAVQLAVRHSPAFEFTAPLTGAIDKLNTTQQFKYTIQWQRGRSDQDLDGNAIISLYYTGIDPTSKSYAGTDSTQLLATTGADSGRAVLIVGNIREDDEERNDQYIWDFRNPPGELPKVFRPQYASGAYRNQQYQAGSTVDTAWIYAVLSDSLGNTRVEPGGAVLLLGSQETPASQAPRVIMKTPPAGGMTMVNGDVVRLEWDDFLIDDGTGTDDAYLRLYAAPKGKYSTLSELEANNTNDPGGDVFVINSLDGKNDFIDCDGCTQGKITRIRESGENFFLWDTKTTSFKIQGTPTELDIFVAASMDPRFGEDVYVNTVLDSIASGIGSQAQKAVLSKSPGTLRVEGADPIYSIELGPARMTASSDDTLDFQVLINSQSSSIDQMALFLDVPRNYFELIDQDATQAGLQPFADSTGAFKTPSTIAQNDTTQGTAQFLKLNFVEAIVSGEVVGNTAGDSSQVAATLQLKVKRYTGGAPLDTVLVWSSEAGRKTAFRRGTTELAAPAREVGIILTPRARIIATVPLQGRTDYSDTLDVHMRLIGSTYDITDQNFIEANDIKKDTLSSSGESTTLGLINASGTFTAAETATGTTSGATGTVVTYVGSDLTLSSVLGTFSNGETVTGGTSAAEGEVNSITVNPPDEVVLADSVQVVSDAFGTFTLTEIPPGLYEVTVKAKGYISGRSDTLNLFNGTSVTVDPTFASDLLGNLAPATAATLLKGGDATGDNQVDLADANRVFGLWNQTPADSTFDVEADINADDVINSLDLGFVTQNFGNDGYGAPPVFKRNTLGGDNSAAMVEVTGIEEVDAWWPGRVFEVTTHVKGMNDVMAYGFTLSYDPERVKPVGDDQAVEEGDIFADNPRGSLFFSQIETGSIEVGAGRIGGEWSASGDAELATVRFVTLTDDPGQIEVIGGELVNSDFQGVAMQVEAPQVLPQVVSLHQNFPNPFNPSTEIRFDLPTARDVQLRVYNQLGQTIRTLVDNRMKAGSYRLKWDGTTEEGRSVSSGVYFYSLDAGDFSQIRKMTLVK